MLPPRCRVVRSLLCLVYLAGFAVLAAAAPSERVFTVRGIVRGPYQDSTVSIQHEEIPNFMPAMTMPFYVDAADAKDLAPGDRVEFEFRVGERSRATKFRKLGNVPSPAMSRAAAQLGSIATATTAPRMRLRAGDTVPPFTLTDQDNRAVTEASLRSGHTVLTFVFTRCPVPEFCPLLGMKFQSLQKELGNRSAASAADGVQLLSISIDPEYDQPAVLRTYGQSLGADFSRWRFATGAKQEVEKLTKLFAVRAERSGNALDHTLATALIAPNGKVVEIWRGNAWKPEEITAKLEAVLPTNQ